MNREVLEAVGIDYQEGLKRFSGVKDIYEKYLRCFLSDTHFNEAFEAFRAKDYQTLELAAHSCKGIAGNLSMTTLYAQYARVLQNLRDQNYTKIDEAMRRAQKIYETIYNTIEAEGKN